MESADKHNAPGIDAAGVKFPKDRAMGVFHGSSGYAGS